jgi:hypothetical protein
VKALFPPWEYQALRLAVANGRRRAAAVPGNLKTQVHVLRRIVRRVDLRVPSTVHEQIGCRVAAAYALEAARNVPAAATSAASAAAQCRPAQRMGRRPAAAVANP